MIYILLFCAACFLAYSNGANDNFKGVATLFGSGTTNYKTAIAWATITTALGSVSAIFLAQTLVKNFSGKGLVPDDLLLLPFFAIAIALGAAITVLVATKIGMPISTTHALVGSLFGAGVMAVGNEFNFAKLGGAFLMPLVVSPLMAAGFSFLIYLLFRFLRKQLGITKQSCICVSEAVYNAQLVNFQSALKMDESITITTSKKGCTQNYTGKLLGVSSQEIVDKLHFLSAGVVSFARGLNDTPKIVGLLLIIGTLDIKYSMLAIAITMAIGGLLNAKKVGITMSKKITPMNTGQGFTANLITGLLVTTASVHGLPVSTTHVSIGSIFGIGAATKKANTKMIGKIVLSWILTLPIAAIISSLIYLIFSQFS